jgi:hypothetical protein
MCGVNLHAHSHIIVPDWHIRLGQEKYSRRSFHQDTEIWWVLALSLGFFRTVCMAKHSRHLHVEESIWKLFFRRGLDLVRLKDITRILYFSLFY